MLSEKDKWDKKTNSLIYVERGLTEEERKYINKTLTVKAVRFMVNLRYATDPLRYNKMKKRSYR